MGKDMAKELKIYLILSNEREGGRRREREGLSERERERERDV